MTTRPRKPGPARPERVITADLVRQALGFIPPDVGHDERARLAFAVYDGIGDAGKDLWLDWAGQRSKPDASEDASTWKSARKPGPVKVGTLFGVAKDHGFRFPEEDGATAPVQAPAHQAEAERLAEQKRQQRAAEEAEYHRRADQAARDARALWDSASDEGESPYLQRKGVQGHGVRYLAGAEGCTLIVPLRDAAGELQNVQRIAPAKPTNGDPEKRFMAGGRKSGLWHLIGSIEGADALLIGEGYATCATVHEATGRPVAVAFDAGNLVHVARALREQWPALALVVCGDDDSATEAKTGKNPGREKAATAARAVLTESGPAGVVFPEGLPNGGSDFNDLGAHAGLEVVRALIDAAASAPTIPKARRGAKGGASAPNDTTGNTTHKATRASGGSNGSGGDDQGASPGQEDPFHLVSDTAGVSPMDGRCNRPGLWFYGKTRDGDSMRPMWLCAPLYVTALTRTEDGNGWGMLLEFKDPDGRTKLWAMPAAVLSGEGSEWAGRLRDMGLRMAPGTTARNRVAQYLDTRHLTERVTCTDRVGWHNGVYVQPSQAVKPQGYTGSGYVFQTEQGIDDTFRQRGDVADWITTVAEPAAGNSRLVFALCCAFGGPLMGPLCVQTGGFHLVGDSSLGKSTVLLAAASVWGAPRFMQQWRTTDNALEATAAQHSDCLLILDEISQVEGRIVGECSYMIANEQEKSRNTRTSNPRRKRTWKLLFLSSGEKGLADHMAEAGKKPNEGQLLRMPSVPADAGAGLGVLEDLHGADDGKAFVEAITQAAATHYGTAGAEWLQWLADHMDEATTRASTLMQRFQLECVPEHAHPQVRRVAARFAVVAAAGELATKAGLTGWEVGEAVRGVRRCFEGWLAKRGHTGDGERYAMLAAVKAQLEKNGDALFTWMHRAHEDHRPNTPLRWGFRRAVDDQGNSLKFDGAQEWIDKRSTEESQAIRQAQWQYLVYPEAFKREVCKGFDPEAVGRLLRDRGHLATEGDRLTTRQRLPGTTEKVSVYLIKPSVFADDFEGL